MTTLAPSVSINTQHPRARAIPKLAEVAPMIGECFAIRHRRAEIANEAGNANLVDVYLAKVMLRLDPTEYIGKPTDAKAIENKVGHIRHYTKIYDEMLEWMARKGITLANEFGADPLVVIKYRDLRGMKFTVKLYME